MTCESCGHQQDEGRFCESCGNELHKVEEQTVSSTETTEGPQEISATKEDESVNTESTSDTNEAVEKVKEFASNYWAYFMHFLKQPTHEGASRSKDYLLAIINIVIATLFISLTTFKMFSSGLGSMGLGVSTSKFVFNIFMFLIISVAVAIALIFVINMFFCNKNLQFTEVISEYGSKFSVIIVLSFVALVLSLMNVYTLTSYLTMFSVLAALFLVPFFIVSTMLKESPQTLDAFYAYLVYFIGFVIIFRIVSSIFAESILAGLFSQLFNFGGFDNPFNW